MGPTKVGHAAADKEEMGHTGDKEEEGGCSSDKEEVGHAAGDEEEVGHAGNKEEVTMLPARRRRSSPLHHGPFHANPCNDIDSIARISHRVCTGTAFTRANALAVFAGHCTRPHNIASSIRR